MKIWNMNFFNQFRYHDINFRCWGLSFDLWLFLLSSFIYDDFKYKFIYFDFRENNWTTCDIENCFSWKIYFMTFNINEKNIKSNFNLIEKHNRNNMKSTEQQIGKNWKLLCPQRDFLSMEKYVCLWKLWKPKNFLKRKTQNIVPIKSSEKKKTY